ncbi:unnamed protein product (macronuclear) [Paramecium tetraurelia]|uniref:ADP-ribosylation factor n=1 Tax=Paramecium tetraurelia TaxID=5888 RepID=A0CKH0_PARTE|nr:uncharacterized protein GSPATT00001001001 [Paramecium tetraurelia]CAK71287.1 unnamed protein product [Paramecium tetraurelia]|eukprot:XP_001438684.1 hypothetical protein (macronuclear) [Paramecium tetraurelia strain d4-2]
MGCVNSRSVEVYQRKFKLVIVGLEGSGKTSIFEYIRQGKFVQTKPTVGVNVDFSHPEFMIFDVGGKVPSLWSNYYENTDGLIFIIDSSNKEQLYQVKEQFVKLNKDLEYLNVVILIMFTKQDKIHLDNQVLIQECGVFGYLEQDTIFQMCSAKTGDGVQEGIQKLINLIKKQQKPNIPLNPIKQHQKKIAV